MAVIEVDSLYKRYAETVAVDGVSFAVEAGEIFGILGPNGAGKTTTVECIDGLRRADGGRIRVLGLDPQRDHDALRLQVGVQLQAGELPDKLEVGEAIRLVLSQARAHRPAARPARSGVKARDPLPEALRRSAPAPVDRAGPGRAAEDRGARRADDRLTLRRDARHGR